MKREEFQNLEHDKKLDEVYESVEKTRKYLFWTFIVSVVFIVLPLIALLFAIPKFLSAYDFGALGI
jgi:type IV secretory pathway component VirB8